MQAVLRIERLPDSALDAATEFYHRWQPQAVGLLAQGANALAIVVPPARYDHSDWRRTMVRDLARRHAPSRVNMIAGDEPEAIDAALDYLARAPGVTGQLLVVGGQAGGTAAE